MSRRRRGSRSARPSPIRSTVRSTTRATGRGRRRRRRRRGRARPTGIDVPALSFEAASAAKSAAATSSTIRPKCVRSCTAIDATRWTLPQVAHVRLSKTPYFSLIQGIIRRERLFLPMRRLCSHPALLAWSSSLRPLAAAGATGDGVLELHAVDGTVVDRRQGRRLGPDGQGQARSSRPDPGDGDVLVSGAERKTPGADDTTRSIYTGRDIHFRVTGGKYKLSVRRQRHRPDARSASAPRR